MENEHEFLRRGMEKRETLLKTTEALLRMKLISKRADLSAATIYYRFCNSVCRVLLRIF